MNIIERYVVEAGVEGNDFSEGRGERINIDLYVQGDI